MRSWQSAPTVEAMLVAFLPSDQRQKRPYLGRLPLAPAGNQTVPDDHDKPPLRIVSYHSPP